MSEQGETSSGESGCFSCDGKFKSESDGAQEFLSVDLDEKSCSRHEKAVLSKQGGVLKAAHIKTAALLHGLGHILISGPVLYSLLVQLARSELYFHLSKY